MLQSGPVGVLMSAFAFVEGLRAHAIVLFNRRSRAGDLLLNCEDIPNLTVRALDRRGGVLSNSDECCRLTD